MRGVCPHQSAPRACLCSPPLTPPCPLLTSAAHTPADWRPVRRLGGGAYADVVEAVPASGDGPTVALKIVDKRHALRSGAVGALRAERATLDALRATPGVAHLLFTYQTPDELVFGLELVPGGELLAQIEAVKETGENGLNENVARRYAADIVLTLSHLRAAGIVHRDIKPENLVLDSEGHLVLVDFGSAAFSEPAADAAARAAPPAAACAGGATHPLSSRRAAPMPGTADYIAPEALGGGGGGKESDSDDDDDSTATPSPPSPPHPFAADVWALGCATFHMLTGAPPFRGGTEYATLRAVAAGTYTWPPSTPASPAARAFVDACLTLDPGVRLGSVCGDDIKQHPWFEGLDWSTHAEARGPPYTPPRLPPPDDEELEWGLAAATASLALGGQAGGGGGGAPLTYHHDGGGSGGAVGGGVHAVSAETAAAVVAGEEAGSE